MFLLWGLLKAVFTDISGGFHPRKFKDPAEDIPVSQIARDIRDYTALLKMSQDELSEEQQQALLAGDEEAREAATTLHSFPSKDEQTKLKPGQEEEELVQKQYEEVIEAPDEVENSKTEASNDSPFPEIPSTLGPSLDWEEGSEPDEAGDAAETTSFDADVEADLDSGGFDGGAYEGYIG